MSEDYDNSAMNRLQATPDQDQRLERASHGFERPRLMKPWVAVVILVAIVATFVLLLSLDSGSSNNPAPPLDGESVATSPVDER